MRRSIVSVAILATIFATLLFWVQPRMEELDANPVRTFSPHAGLHDAGIVPKHIAFSTDASHAVGECIYSFLAPRATPGGTRHKFYGWDLKNRRVLFEWELENITSEMNFMATPDASVFATIDNQARQSVIVLYSGQTGEEIGRFPTETEYAWGGAFSPDGRTLAMNYQAQGQKFVGVWDWKSGKRLNEFPVPDSASLIVSPDGTKILTHPFANGDQARLYDLTTGQPLGSFPGLTGHNRGMAFSPDSECIALSERYSAVQLWDIETGGSLQKFTAYPDGERVVGLTVFSPDGRYLAASFSTRGLPNLARKSLRYRLRLFLLRWAPYLVRLDLTAPVKVWDTQTGRLVHGFGLNEGHAFLTFTPDSKQLITADWHGDFRWWDIEEKQ